MKVESELYFGFPVLLHVANWEKLGIASGYLDLNWDLQD
jgi:hypothetical protein